MFNIFKKFFDFNEKEIGRIRKKVEGINSFEEKARKIKDVDFKKETEKLKDQVQSNKKTLDEVLPWSYALVREAARRVLGQRHYDVQLIAGVALHEGKIAEQKTGEGKTLSAISPLYLNALAGKGAHLVTVNDYLARRDAGWMGSVFHKLGLSTSAIISDKSFIYDPNFEDEETGDWRLAHLKSISRKEAYLADITYGINSEFGFDYLRDNMASSPTDVVQRDYNFAVIDEADSILIDEARTPHIISAPFDDDTTKYYKYTQIVKRLDSKTDYIIDEKLRTANLTESGIKKIESMLSVTNVYEKDFDTLFHIEAALKAITLFKLDKDYIVKDQQVIIVDEFTGRLLYGRRFSEGLHQAIEAKENVPIQRESKTLATVSLQNYFRGYQKLAGMTGTAATEAEEFNKIYKTDVLVIPTHMKMVRKDRSDMIYKTERGKFNAVAEEIAINYKRGRPVLVGTTSIEKNETLSRLLKQKGVPHELLNAKNHEREAMIIANAGKKGAITVATNMAGRGVDIILGGDPPTDKKEMQKWQKAHDEVVSLGGLYVIGTERHESRRIDNQLRGRSGRQGDPGETCFFVGLDDDLMRIFGGEQISKLMTFFNFPEDQSLTHPMVSKAIEQAQVKVEGFNFDIRKHLVDFDDVLNKQREIIYTQRKKILTLPESDKNEFRKTIQEIFSEELNTLVNALVGTDEYISKENLNSLEKELNLILPTKTSELVKHAKNKNLDPLLDYLAEKVEKEYKSREKQVGEKIWMEIVRAIFLSTIDKYWTEHLTGIEDLREGINLRGYAQLDPLVEYKNEAYTMFERLVGDINFEATRRIFKVEIENRPTPLLKKEEAKPMVYKSASRVNPFVQKESQSNQLSVISNQSNAEKLRTDNRMPRGDEPARITVTSRNQPQHQHDHSHDHQHSHVHGSQPAADNQFGFKINLPGQSAKKPGRNDPCWCGSGKKYKKCHLLSDLA